MKSENSRRAVYDELFPCVSVDSFGFLYNI